MNLVSPELFKDKQATELEHSRTAARKTGRTSYDCFNALVFGDKVRCRYGHVLGTAREGSLPFVTVVRGTHSAVCTGCKDYEH
jgi:hypothetical protein